MLLALALGAGACARPEPYLRRELSIPVRDGVQLHAIALSPRGATDSLPIILIRTPFGADREVPTSEVPPPYLELAKDGYIFVVEDVRGRGGSGGSFESLRPLHDGQDTLGTDESTDAWDTIDWLVKNLPGNSGKVGMLGISYRGWLAAMGGVHPHPALRAISPQGPVADTWLGDDFFHQGAFRQTQGVAYAAWIELGRAPTLPEIEPYDAYLGAATLDSLAKAAGVAEAASWTGFAAHPAYDDYWRRRALQNALTYPTVPTLWVGGWWDQEDILGAELMYHTLEAHDTTRENHVVLGPWSHGSWARTPGDSIGAIPLGSRTAAFFRDSIQRPWFAYHLHGRGSGDFPDAWTFETGEGAWHTDDAWPPRQASPRELYLGPAGRLSLTLPAAAGDEFTRYTSDPATPVPYVPRPEREDGWPTWLVQDQRFLEGRPDVLSWVSDPLAEDFTIAGDVTARLFASTTGSDADWVVKLIDVYPDSMEGDPGLAGYELMVAADILRGRYWGGFDRPAPIAANKVTPFTVDLHQQRYRFRRGHRIMVQVQSSWFPLYDRNPQQFIPNIFAATPADFRAAEHRVWHTPHYPSRISVLQLSGD